MRAEQGPGVPRARADLFPRLTDFGLAKLAEEAGDETRSEVRMGTAHYMAPEQAAGRRQRGRPRDRRLCPGRDPLSDPGGPAAVPRRDRVRDPAPGPRIRAGPAAIAAPGAAARPGDDLPEVPVQGAGAAVRHGGATSTTTCGGSWKGVRSGAADLRGGAGVAVVPAEQGGGGAAGGGLRPAGGGGRCRVGRLCARGRRAGGGRSRGEQGERRGRPRPRGGARDPAAVVCRQRQPHATGLGRRPGGPTAGVADRDRGVSRPGLRVVLLAAALPPRAV